ncbi:MAG: DUF6288 domain-containing protein [Planctomycetota bacterium]|nr:DUF6288 domain-containing protein [Planctomycetota bacterium]
MKKNIPHRIIALASALLIACSPMALARPEVVPDLTKATPQNTRNNYNLGPTGALGWMNVEGGMTEKARQILVTAVEKGSPADGKLMAGDVILGVFGKPFTRDARRTFGEAIGQAETEEAGGLLPLIVWRPVNKKEPSSEDASSKGLPKEVVPVADDGAGDEDNNAALEELSNDADPKKAQERIPEVAKGNTLDIEIQLKVMGAYSDTSPYDCPKAKKILEQGLRLIADDITRDNRFPINELALLASGKPEYLELVRKSVHEIAARTPEKEELWRVSNHNGKQTWSFGYYNTLMAEYYLATGDKVALGPLESYTACLSRGQGMFGTWGHGLFGAGPEGNLHAPVPPYGPVNAAGLPCFVSLVLAEKCGIEEPELRPAIERANKFFGYYAGKGAIPYGEHRPGAVHDDNGKTSMTAMAFALQGKNYETRFFSKMVTASYESREWGHGGNGFSYVWGPIAANCGGPKAIAAFMKELRWYYDLARRWDGAFVYTDTGGGVSSSYRGVFNSTASYMLGYAVGLKKIYLTGRDANPGNWLTEADVAEAIAAERWLGEGAHSNRTTAQLLTGLASWSPLDRVRSAAELARRQDDVLSQLLEMVNSNNTDARLGAVHALGQLGERAVPALYTLAGLLNDDDRWIRVQAAEALRSIGEHARPVLPQMLKAAAIKDENDLMEFGVGALAYALFYPGGAYGPQGILAGSIKETPKELLYPAIRLIANNPDSHARGCLRSTYGLLTIEDVKALAPEFLNSVKDMAPANTMFSKGARIAGIQAMGRLHIAEGLPLGMMMLNLKDWGRGVIISATLDALKQYGGAARSILPELKKMEEEIRGMKPQHSKMLALLEAIENDQNPPRLISLKEYLDKEAKN